MMTSSQRCFGNRIPPLQRRFDLADAEPAPASTCIGTMLGALFSGLIVGLTAGPVGIVPMAIAGGVAGGLLAGALSDLTEPKPSPRLARSGSLFRKN